MPPESAQTPFRWSSALLWVLRHLLPINAFSVGRELTAVPAREEGAVSAIFESCISSRFIAVLLSPYPRLRHVVGGPAPGPVVLAAYTYLLFPVYFERPNSGVSLHTGSSRRVSGQALQPLPSPIGLSWPRSLRHRCQQIQGPASACAAGISVATGGDSIHRRCRMVRLPRRLWLTGSHSHAAVRWLLSPVFSFPISSTNRSSRMTTHQVAREVSPAAVSRSNPGWNE